MGFFKDIHTISKQSKEIQKNWDVKAQLDQGMAAMQQANAMMAGQTQAAELSIGGTAATVQVTGARDTGTVINLQPVLELDLLVQPDGGAPYPTTLRMVVPASSMGRVVPGSVLKGRVDTAQPTSVWIDWAA